jgi:DNA-binding MarR family transcriptional regulator
MKHEGIELLTRRMFTRIIAALARTLHDQDLSVAQVAALYLVDERGPVRIGEVATELGRPLPATSRLVDDLVRRGWIDRTEDESDRRARVLTLTAAGRKFIARAGADRVRTIEGALESMPPALVSEVWRSIASRLR